MGLPVPNDESAVPNEFVPGVAALVPDGQVECLGRGKDAKWEKTKKWN